MALVGLATKITLPFVALFALLLFVLGLVLAREILSEVEAHVENEQRFVLEVATFPGFAFDEDALRRIRDKSGRAVPGEDSAAKTSEFVVLQEGAMPLSTIARGPTPSSGPQWDTVEAIEKAAKLPPLNQQDDTIKRDIVTLAGRTWLVLHTARATRGPGVAARRVFLLYPYSEIENAKNRALMRILSLGGIGLALAAVLGLVVAHWISSPVRKLAATAKRVTTSGLGAATDAEFSGAVVSGGKVNPDEIGELAQAFQSMLQSLRQSQNELLKAERLAVTGKLAASVAHEIRNPLTSLRMTVQMLQQRAGNADATTQEAYAIVLSEIDRLALAVEELMTVARPRPAQRVPTDLNKLVSDTLKFMERQLSHARVKGLAELDAGLPPEIQIDPNKIRQLLVNLILNAQQAIVRDGTITVRTGWNPSANQAQILVVDTGPGVPQEVRDKLFDLFVSTKAGGGGLGLAIAKQIAEEHGGSISYETSAKGTTFKISLPTAPISVSASH